MSRYIDADFEIAHYTSMTTNPTPDVTEKDKRNSLVILDALRMAKTIDIIRCKECKYYEAKEDWCYWRDEAITADDFCSYGEGGTDELHR